MNSFQTGLLRYFSEHELNTIENITVGIGGAGGLGSNCAMNLVRSGFARFVIADFDTVSPSNLNRQFFFQDQLSRSKVDVLAENLARINPEVIVKSHAEAISPDNIDRVFRACDVIVEAFDDPQAKKLLVEHFGNDTLTVAASGIAGCGQADRIITRRITERLYIVGDFASESSEALPPYSPGVAIAAAKQADIILRYALDRAAETKQNDQHVVESLATEI